MASNPFSFLCISCIFMVIMFFVSPCNAGPLSLSLSVDITPGSVCSATLFPDFCKSILPNNQSSNVYDYSRFSIRRALSTTSYFKKLIDSYMARRSIFSIATIGALEDCRFLFGLSIDFLSRTINTIDSTDTLLDLQTYELQTLLSAIVTNHETCFSGIQATSLSGSIRNELDMSLSDGNKLLSVSLALFNHGWRPKHNGGVFNLGRDLVLPGRIGKYGSLNFRMSVPNHQKFESVFHKKKKKLAESVRGRMVSETRSDSIIIRDIVAVDPDGSGDFTTINAAVSAAPNNTVITDGYFLIYVVSGVYEEYVNIGSNKKNIMMLGDGINQTVITGNRSVGDGWSTFNSATFIVVGQGFVGINMTIQNTAGPSKGQAVALRNGGDLTAFYGCSFEAYQDTLYTHSLRQFYRECDVYGTVDFIFGNAAVVLQNCNIYPRLPMKGQFNTITAQGRTDPGQNTGTSIHNCIITAAPDLASSNRTVQTVLGRPWKQYSRTVYMQSFMDKLIDPIGWNPWNGDFLSTLYYAEFDNRGPGSNTSRRVNWPGYHVINSTEAAPFTTSNLTSGDAWLPATGVPYKGGLFEISITNSSPFTH